MVASKKSQASSQRKGKNNTCPLAPATESLGPKLSFSSRHNRVTVMPFGLPPKEALPEVDLVGKCIESPYMERYQFVKDGQSWGRHGKGKIRSRTTQGE